MKNWFIACGLAASLVFARTARAADEGAELTGKVITVRGKPIKDVTVFIYTAGPKVGTGSICPSCYPDCRKKARTDADGHFKIEALDPKLQFKLLAVGKGWQPKFVSKVDPENSPQEIAMDTEDDDPSRIKIKGMVINSLGNPVFGAVLNVEGIEKGRSTHWGGVAQEADPVGVTDEDGIFTLRCSEEAKAIHAKLEANGFAKRWVRLVPPNDQIIRMDDGVTVRGRLERDGKGVPNVVVAMATVEREAGKHLHDYEAVTDKDGNFAVMNVTPELTYNLYGKMSGLGNKGSLPAQRVTAGKTDTAVELGTVHLSPAFKLKGRIVLSDGEEIPPKTRVNLGREDAWDYTETTVHEDGSFEFLGVPLESVGLNVRIRGYKMSHKNPSLDWYNGGLVGRMDKDLDDFIILLDPGEWRYNEEINDAPPEAQRQPRDLPLRGAKL